MWSGSLFIYEHETHPFLERLLRARVTRWKGYWHFTLHIHSFATRLTTKPHAACQSGVFLERIWNRSWKLIYQFIKRMDLSENSVTDSQHLSLPAVCYTNKILGGLGFVEFIHLVIIMSESWSVLLLNTDEVVSNAYICVKSMYVQFNPIITKIDYLVWNTSLSICPNLCNYLSPLNNNSQVVYFNDSQSQYHIPVHFASNRIKKLFAVVLIRVSCDSIQSKLCI